MGKQQESLFERLTFFVWVSKNIEIISQILLILALSSQKGEEERRRPTGCHYHNVATVYFQAGIWPLPSKQGSFVCCKNSDQPKTYFGPLCRIQIFLVEYSVLFRLSFSLQLWSAHHRVFSAGQSPLSTRQTHLDTFMFLGRTFSRAQPTGKILKWQIRPPRLLNVLNIYKLSWERWALDREV